ncbi:MAG: hypothetical protein ABW098_02195 [Candidatus Thiodiazotropha sp.]
MTKEHLLFTGFVALLLLILLSMPSSAGLQMGLSIGSLNATGWSMENVRVDLELIDRNQLNLSLAADSFTHQALPGVLEGIRLDCPVEQQQQSYVCNQGRLHIANSDYGSQDLEVSGVFVDPEHLSVDIQGMRFAHGELKIGIKLIEGGWDASLHANRIRLESLPGAFIKDRLPKGSVVSGVTNLKLKASGVMDQAEAIDLTLKIAGFAYADVEGLQVAEEGGFNLSLNAEQRGSGWMGKTKLSVSKGQFYSDPFYIEVADEPLHLQLAGRWKPGSDRLYMDESRLLLPKVLESRGRVVIDTNSGELVEAKLRLHSDDMGALYGVLLQPLLIGTMADEVEASGLMDSVVQIENRELQRFHASLEDVNLDDSRGLFALYGLNGQMTWNREPHADMSKLSIEGGQLYRIDFGKLDIHAYAQQGEARLNKPIDLSLLQGTLHIDQLNAEGLLGEQPQWTTSAQFKDISLQALAEAFDWPTMEGMLQGTIPRVHYQQQRLQLDGELVVDVFGGRIRVGDLLIEDPLGRVPELYADLQLSGLDLTQITQTFSFGHMTGGLEGEIAGLHLSSWEPIAFKARFNTPDEDKIPHRISQRAVDNLTALGNGVGSGLSSTFLGIFKEFRYNRIELKAILNGDVAELDGMPHKSGGYYIVKGSGLPRIDVIARNRQVAWKTLLERLKSIRVEGMEMR